MSPTVATGFVCEMAEVSENIEDLHSLLPGSSIAERRAFVRSFVKEIVVEGTEAVVEYALPGPQASLGHADGEDGEVLAIVASGTPGGTRTPATGSGGRCSIR